MDDISETDRIERDLAATRARMDSRLDELQEHLTPKQMLNDAFAYFRGGEGADFTKDLVTRARANPLPVALVGVGIAWLMASIHSPAIADRRLSPPRQDDSLEARLRHAEVGVQRLDHDDDDSYAARLDDVRGKVVGVARDASDTAASYARRIKDAVASAAQSVRETSHDLKAGASDAFARAGNSAGERGASIQEGTNKMTHQGRSTLASVASNPFALGALAAVVGIVAGALLPTSDEEEAALGSVATKLRTAGRDLAQDVVDRGGRIATDTLDAVKGSAEAHGLTADKPVGELLADVKSGDLLGNVEQVAQESVQAGKEAAQTHIAGDAKTGAEQPAS
ncbi:DUF3618 domain-containing protein [Sphingomonas nostoxanthinifaciens]|uniref:DUF3618 domain-containing protein n=1 Tax=Sphingomonas nostoxanthinifaciens TaxID=2872652 RepID=UPI001CC1E534|nr:DUF3618 domain-containing protein [Sphingomonas nostoxanthinifaciens]UAK25633.1 DUF3618 domain-containing protein [Sphingomonas nostoxanthinifaciens]